MARVKNQVLFEDEESYTDAAGQVHFNGVSYRQGATEAYPGYIGAEFGTVRKSPRARRPPHQGRGSAAQGPYRDCFAACADRWKNLPDACGDDQACDPTSSKERVLDAKADAGVSCSAFDLYMRCCMRNCAIIQVSGPGGASYSGGVIPDAESCFKCPDNLPAFSVAAASPVVSCGSSIDLSVDPAPAPGVSWSISLVSGGGTLVGDIYTAPSTNPNCENNPSFELAVCGQVVGSFSLAVNCSQLGIFAYLHHPGPCRYFNDVLGMCYCWRGGASFSEHWRQMDCAGNDVGDSSYYTLYGPFPRENCGLPDGQECSCGSMPDTIDNRSAEQKAAGCCPPGF